MENIKLVTRLSAPFMTIMRPLKYWIKLCRSTLTGLGYNFCIVLNLNRKLVFKENVSFKEFIITVFLGTVSAENGLEQTQHRCIGSEGQTRFDEASVGKSWEDG